MEQPRDTPPGYRIVDPRTGAVTATGHLRPGEIIDPDPAMQPRVIIFR